MLSLLLCQFHTIHVCFCPFHRLSDLPYPLRYSAFVCAVNDTCAQTPPRERSVLLWVSSHHEYRYFCEFLHTGIQSRIYDTIARWWCDVVKVENLLETTGKRTDETTTINTFDWCIFCMIIVPTAASVPTYRNVNRFYNGRCASRQQRRQPARTGLLVEGARLRHKCITEHTRKSNHCRRTFATKWFRAMGPPRAEWMNHSASRTNMTEMNFFFWDDRKSFFVRFEFWG